MQHGVNLLLTGVVYQASNLWFSRVVCCASANRSKNKTRNHKNESFAGQSSNQLISQPKKQANQKKHRQRNKQRNIQAQKEAVVSKNVVCPQITHFDRENDGK